LKLDFPKGFGEEVSELALRADVDGLDAPILQAAPYEVILHPDVLVALMEDGVLRQGQSGLVVHPELNRFGISTKEITKQSSQPDRLREAEVVAMYSASQLDRAATCCLTVCQLTRHLPRKNIILLVLFLVSMSPAWSLSL
jgi:hypothetical protein